MEIYRKRFNKIVKEIMKLTPSHWIAIAAIALTFLAFILYHTQFSDFARCKKAGKIEDIFLKLLNNDVFKKDIKILITILR